MKETLTLCPICGSKLIANGINAAENIREENKNTIADIVKYNRCLGCGVMFQNPRMDKETLQEYYSSGKYREQVSSKPQAQDDDEKKRAEYIYRAIYDSVTKSAAPESHLDIGCSRGYLLKSVAAKRRVGVDLNPGYCAFKDIEIYTSLDGVTGKFDVITMIHELEHELDPLATLKKVSKLLKPSGTLMIEVPSVNSPGSPYRLSHTFAFEPWSLNYLMEKAGFKIKGIAFTPHILVSAVK